MNYQKIYNQLIEHRIQNPLVKCGGSIESHHILPKKMGGSNNTENLVNLTVREHIIAHMLLFKIHRNKSMAYALNRITNFGENRGSRLITKLLTEHRKIVAEDSRIRNTGILTLKHISTGEIRKFNKTDDIDRCVWFGVNYGVKFDTTNRVKRILAIDENGNYVSVTREEFKARGLHGINYGKPGKNTLPVGWVSPCLGKPGKPFYENAANQSELGLNFYLQLSEIMIYLDSAVKPNARKICDVIGVGIECFRFARTIKKKHADGWRIDEKYLTWKLKNEIK